MSVATALLRVAPVATSAEMMEPESVRHHEMLERGGFRALPGKEIAVEIDHEGHVIGHVSDTFCELDPTGGHWLFALAKLDEVPDWLEPGRSGISITRAATFHKTMPGGWELLRSGTIREISLLSPGVEPAFPRARLMTLTRSPAAGSVTSDRAASSPAKYDDMLSRYGFEDGDDLEAFKKAAMRSPLDKAYDEHIASRVTATGVLIRPGIGQVLGVR